MNISSNVSSINAHQKMLNGSANNLANVNTDGFVPSDTAIISSDNTNVRAYTRSATDNGSSTSQTDVAKELTDQIISQDAVGFNVTAMKTQDQMLGSLLDIKT